MGQCVFPRHGFEILPPAGLDRPRVDVTLRISGLFRDVFPAQITLFDEVSRPSPRSMKRRRSIRSQEPERSPVRIFGARRALTDCKLADAGTRCR